MSQMTFRSKVDVWIGVLLLLPPVAGVVTCLGAGPAGWIGASVPLLIVLAAYGGVVFPMRYTLEDEALVIRFGLVRSRVQYAAIRAVRPTRNPISSPALSLDRLHLDTGSRLGPNISPDDKATFVAELGKRCPHLEPDGSGGLRPVAA